MKNTLVSIFFILYSFLGYSQEIDPLNINNLIPKWQHVLKDTNFVQDSIGLNIRTPYTICFPYVHKIQSNQLLINNHCTTGHGERHGNLIQNIDLSTGEMKWVAALNNDTYLVNSQEFFPGIFYDNKSKEVVLKGFKKYGGPAKSGFGWIFPQPSLAATIHLDGSDGKVVHHITNQNIADTIKWSPLRGYFLQSLSNKYWIALGEFQLNNQVYRDFKYSVSQISENQELVSTPDLSYIYKPIDSLPYLIESEDNIFGTDDFNNFYGLVVQKFLHQNTPYKIELQKMHINENENISTSKLELKYKKSLNAYLQLPEVFQGFFTSFKAYDDAVFISTLYVDTLDNSALKRWLLCLDENGNEKFYIKEISLDGYFAETLEFLGRKNGKTYFFTRDRRELDYTAIIFSVDENGKIEKYGSVKSGDINSKINGLRGIVTDNNELVLAVQVNNMYYYTACFDGKDFGIDFTNNTSGIAYSRNKIKIYPNPMTDYITIQQMETDLEKGTIYFINHLGITVKTSSIIGSQTQIQISDLPNGIYFVKIISDNGDYLHTQKIIKMS
jgi:Secretion system C-terminal sorting domain